MKYLPLCLCFLVLLLDQCAKVLVVKTLMLNVQYVPVFGDFVGLRYIENAGMALGLFSDLPKYVKDVLFNLLTLFAVVMIVRFYSQLKKEDLFLRNAFAVILGGALGNMCDKVFGFLVFHGEWRFFYGRVVDFVDLGFGAYRWPTFNLADVAISLGLVALFWKSFVKKDYDIFVAEKP